MPGRTIGSRGLTDDEDISEGADVYEPVFISINERFVGTTFLFPSSKMEETQRPFALVDIETTAVIEAAKLVSDADDHLERAKIGVDQQGKNLRPETQQRVAVPSFQQSENSVKRELIKRVMGTRLIQASRENDSALRRRIVPTFMKASGIEQWTEKAKQSAVLQLVALVKREAKKAEKSNTVVDVAVAPIEFPTQVEYELPFGKELKPRLNVTKKSTKKDAGFEELQFYGPWVKGLFQLCIFPVILC